MTKFIGSFNIIVTKMYLTMGLFFKLVEFQFIDLVAKFQVFDFEYVQTLNFESYLCKLII